jgi:hypothetical protein
MPITEAALFSLVGSLLGIVIGGGLQVARDLWLRSLDVRTTRAGLHAAVSALLLTIEVRGLHRHLVSYAKAADEMIANGEGDVVISFPRFPASNDYFAQLDLYVTKAGLLRPAEAAAFSNFVHLAKSASEMAMYRPQVPATSHPANRMVGHLYTEAYMMEIAIEAGRAIIERRKPRPIEYVGPRRAPASHDDNRTSWPDNERGCP